MSVEATGNQSIIERANDDHDVRRWLVLAGDLDNFTAEVLSCIVEQVILREHQNICKLRSQSDYECAVKKLFCQCPDYNYLVTRSQGSDFSLVRQNAIEFAKLFYRHDLSCNSFSQLDVTVLLHIMSSCTRFSYLVPNQLKLIRDVRNSRNSVFHNNQKHVENNEFVKAIECVRNLLSNKSISSAWSAKKTKSQCSIDERLNTIKDMPSHMSFTSEHAFKALSNEVIVLQRDYETQSSQVIELKDDRESMNTVSDKLVEAFQAVIDLFLLQAGMPISVSWESDVASSLTFREQQQYKLDQMKSFIASLKSVQERRLPQSTADDNLCPQLRRIREELKSCIDSKCKKLRDEIAKVDRQMNEITVRMDDFERRMSTLEIDRMPALEADCEALKKSAVEESDRVKSLETVVQEMKQQYREHGSQILAVDANCKTIEQSTIAVKDQVTKMETKVQQMEQQQQHQGGLIWTLKNEVNLITRLQHKNVEQSELSRQQINVHTEQINILQQLQGIDASSPTDSRSSLTGKLGDLNVRLQLTLLLVGCK